MIEAYEGIAFNQAPDSDNEIHSDEMAQRFGFEGGLVPGVTVSAYLVQPGVEVWGDAFFAGGGAHVQILKPTYHDEPFRCEITVQTDAHFESQIVNSTGRVNAVATVTRHVEEQRQPLPIFRGDPLASPDYLAPNATPERFEALKEKGCLATEYLFDAANPRTWYFHTASQMPRTHQPGGGDAEAVAPTSFLLGCGNWIFSANARMNPWVHLETHHRSIAPIRQGETVRCEMLVEEWFERRGHLFADVTVSLFEAQSKVARAVIHQRAIYRLRGSDAPA